MRPYSKPIAANSDYTLTTIPGNRIPLTFSGTAPRSFFVKEKISKLDRMLDTVV